MRIFSKFFGAALVAAVALFLQACGGGGGGGGGDTTTSNLQPATTGSSLPSNPATTPGTRPSSTPVTPISGPTVMVSGTASYESVPYFATGSASAQAGALNFAGITSKPIRGATVEVVSGTTILARSVTSDTGGYTFKVPQNQAYSIRVLAELVKTSGSATWDVALYDNTNSNAFWMLTGTPSTTTTTDTVRDIVAGTGWGTSSYTGARGAGLFAILDTIYAGMTQIAAVQPSVAFPVLSVYWSAKNTNSASAQNLLTGQFGGKSFFSSGTTASGTKVRAIYILGNANSDSDEFDTTVTAHEFGHYLQSAFSKNPSIGGAHMTDDKLDMTLAFGEGWGNAYSSILRNDQIYADSFVLSLRQGFVFDITDTSGLQNNGWFNEDSVAKVIYGLYTRQNKDFGPIWNAIKGPLNGVQDSLATIFSFADAVRSVGVAAVNLSLNTLLASERIFSGTDASQWGDNETNNGGNASNLPPYKLATLNTPAAANCLTANIKASEINKLGNVTYFRFGSVPAGGHTVTVDFGNGRDVDVEVFQKGTTIAVADSPAAKLEIATFTAPAIGEVTVRLTDYPTSTFTINPSTPSCATVTMK